MDCAEAQELMSERLDGRLDEARCGELDAHVTVCGECAGLWRRFRKLDSLLAECTVEPASPSLGARIAAGVPAPNRRRVFFRPAPIRWAAAALLCAAVGTAAWLALRGKTGTVQGGSPRPVVVASLWPEGPSAEMADYCLAILPSAGKAVSRGGAQLKDSLTGASLRLAAETSRIPEAAGTAGGRFKTEYVPQLIEGLNGFLRALESVDDEKNTAPREGASPAGGTVFAETACHGRRNAADASPRRSQASI